MPILALPNNSEGGGGLRIHLGNGGGLIVNFVNFGHFWVSDTDLGG